MVNLKSTGKYNSVKERRCKIAALAVFVFTGVVYITLILLMIITKFRVLSPLIKFHDSLAYSYNESGEAVKDPKYNSEYIKEQLQYEYENSPGTILYPVCITGALIIVGQGLSIIIARKNGKFMFSDHVTGVIIDGIFDAILIVVSLFVYLWRNGFGVMQEIGTGVEPSKIYYWLFLLPLIVLDALFVSFVNKAAYYEGKYQEEPAMKLQQRSNVKYCKKCGAPINNSAVLCEDCSGEKSAEQTEVACTSQQPVWAYNPAVAKGRPLIIATGVIYIAVGIIMTVINLVFAEALDYVSPYVSILRIIMRISIDLGFPLSYTYNALPFMLIIALVLEKFINIFFGIGILLKKQWAVLTVRIFMILGIVVNLFMILILLHPFQPLQAIFPLIFSLINIAYDIVMIFFTSSVVRTLSVNARNYRVRVKERQ